MKHIKYLISVSIAVLALVSCQKKQTGDILTDMDSDCFTFTANLSDTKVYFASDGETLYWEGGESLSLYAVPTISDGGNESLDWSRAFCANAQERGSHISRTTATFSANCTTKELFSKAEEGESLVLLAVYPVSVYPYFPPTILSGNGNTFSGLGASIPRWQSDVNYNNGIKYHFMCGTAGKISLAEALAATEITFGGFRPATSMLSLKFKSASGDINIRQVEIKIVNPVDGDIQIAGNCLLQLDNYESASAWPGNGTIDGSYQAIPYSYIEDATYDEAQGTSAVSSYEDYDSIRGDIWETITTEGSSTYYNYTAIPSKNPEGSYVLINLYDNNYNILTSINKPLPTYTIDGATVYGFLAGRRYLSTITIEPNLQSSTDDWVEAGYYRDINW